MLLLIFSPSLISKSRKYNDHSMRTVSNRLAYVLLFGWFNARDGEYFNRITEIIPFQGHLRLY